MTSDEATTIVRIGEKVLAEARALGWLNLSDAEALRARLSAAESSLREAREEAEGMRKALMMVVENETVCDEQVADNLGNCRDRYPNEPECWCGFCVAVHALAAKGEG